MDCFEKHKRSKMGNSLCSAFVHGIADIPRYFEENTRKAPHRLFYSANLGKTTPFHNCKTSFYRFTLSPVRRERTVKQVVCIAATKSGVYCYGECQEGFCTTCM